MNRREFSSATLAAILGSATGRAAYSAEPHSSLQIQNLTSPIIIKQIELLKNGREYLVRVRSADTEVVTIPNSSRLAETYPIFLRRIAPFFVGARFRARRLFTACQPQRYTGNRESRPPEP